MEEKSFLRAKKRINEKINIQTINNMIEELFNNFTRQYKEELMLYKQNSRRLSDKIQELEINIHEHKGALEYSKDILKKKDDEISQKLSEQTTLKQENEHLLKRFHELEKEFTANEIKYAQKIEAINTERMQINAEKAADTLQHLKIIEELTANLNDLQEKLQVQDREIVSLKEELKNAAETNVQKMEELRNTFMEEKAMNEAKFANIIKDLECLDDDQNNKAVGCLACSLQTTSQVTSCTKVKTAPTTTHSVVSNLNKYGNRNNLRWEEQQQEGHRINCNSTPKKRATKRIACYTLEDSSNSSDENEERMDINARPLKKRNLDDSFVTTSQSCLRFQGNQDILSDHIVGETSESDAFDRLKLVG